MTVTQNTQFLDFRVCSSLRLSRPSLFGQMIRKRKKTHFWWQNDPWLTRGTSLWCYYPFPKAPSGHCVSLADPSPSLGSGMLARWNQRLTVSLKIQLLAPQRRGSGQKT